MEPITEDLSLRTKQNIIIVYSLNIDWKDRSDWLTDKKNYVTSIFYIAT